MYYRRYTCYNVMRILLALCTPGSHIYRYFYLCSFTYRKLHLWDTEDIFTCRLYSTYWLYCGTFPYSPPKFCFCLLPSWRSPRSFTFCCRFDIGSEKAYYITGLRVHEWHTVSNTLAFNSEFYFSWSYLKSANANLQTCLGLNSSQLRLQSSTVALSESRRSSRSRGGWEAAL